MGFPPVRMPTPTGCLRCRSRHPYCRNPPPPCRSRPDELHRHLHDDYTKPCSCHPTFVAPNHHRQECYRARAIVCTMNKPELFTVSNFPPHHQLHNSDAIPTQSRASPLPPLLSLPWSPASTQASRTPPQRDQLSNVYLHVTFTRIPDTSV
uniref:Uncharacterized protein n=1 Tax=Oryza sativa subsp. indica TaxID=39946 RepID=A0A1V1GZZ2_ORYSI|nr:hypothetical protein [Oryza sativa Indica Group]